MSISKVNVSGTDHQIVGSPRYATCSTAAATAAKVATIADGSSAFSLEKGARICVSFTYANTASAATLNVASTGAKAICWQGSALVSSQYWQAGAVVDFVYDGNGWSIVGIAKDNNSTNFLPLSGGSLTGKLTVPQVETGDGNSNFFQCRKFRGEGDANTYYHAIDFGYQNHDQVDFHEYGGKWNFYKNQSGKVNEGVLCGSITSNGWEGRAKLKSGSTMVTSQLTENSDAIATTAFVHGLVDNVKHYSASNPPPYPVTSVNNKTGAVTLAKGDVGLGNVDNTSDTNKPISNATQAALNDKQSKITANGILKGDGTGTITAVDETEVELVDITPELIGAQPKIIANGFLTSDGEGNVAAEHPVATVRVWQRGDPTPGEKPGEYIYDFGSDYNYAQIIDAQRRGYMVVVNYNGLEYHFTQNDSSYGLIFSTMILSHNCMYDRLRCTSDDKWHIESYTLVSMEHPFRDTPSLTLPEVIQDLENAVGNAQGGVNDLKKKIASITERKMSIVLYSDRWTGSDPYTQTVTIYGSTANTKVDIQPSEEVYDQLVADNVGYLAIKNVNGTLTAVAKGGKPSVDLTVQVTYNNVY